MAHASRLGKRPKVGDNNGQATHGARKPPGQILVVIEHFCIARITAWTPPLIWLVCIFSVVRSSIMNLNESDQSLLI